MKKNLRNIAIALIFVLMLSLCILGIALGGSTALLLLFRETTARNHLPTIEAVVHKQCGKEIVVGREGFGLDPILHWGGRNDGKGASCSYYQDEWICTCEFYPTATR